MRRNFANSPCYTRFIFFKAFLSLTRESQSQVKWNIDWFLKSFKQLVQLKFKQKEIAIFCNIKVTRTQSKNAKKMCPLPFHYSVQLDQRFSWSKILMVLEPKSKYTPQAARSCYAETGSMFTVQSKWTLYIYTDVGALKEITTSQRTANLKQIKNKFLSFYRCLTVSPSLGFPSLKKFLEMFIIIELNAINVILRHKMFDIQFEL